MHETIQTSIGPIHIDSWDDGIDYRIEVGGTMYYLEWSDRFGPNWLRKDRTERKSGVNKSVWNAIQFWFDQGKRHEDGLCIWKPVESELY